MGAYKQFLASDIVVTPFEVNKSFTFQGSASLLDPNVSIERLLGKNITSSIFNPSSDPTTGFSGDQYQRLVYNSVKELYYSNYLSSSYGDRVSRPVLIPGANPEGNAYVGSTTSQAYDNYLQTTLSYPKVFPTASDSILGVISIPVRLFGDYIRPNSFIFSAQNGTFNGTLTDDGEGNVWMSSSLSTSSLLVGNIFYGHGIVTIIGDGYLHASGSLYGSGYYGTSSYGIDMNSAMTFFVTSSNVTCSFSSSYFIYETQYKCTIRENEYNFTLNPSSISGSSDDTPLEFITESYFSPYITTVGLYDEQQNLLAIGKLAQPLPSSPTTDTTILINIDR